MSLTTPVRFMGLSKHQWFMLAKYSLYLLVTINAVDFILTDIKAAAATLGEGFSFRDIQSVFSATIDSIAWISLLLVYELETSVVDDEVLNRGYKWLFYAISLFCYIAIVIAAMGYWGKLQFLLNYSAAHYGDLCQHIGELSLMTELDEYKAITAQNCGAVPMEGLQKLNSAEVVFSADSYQGMAGVPAIAWVDVINSSAWIAVVLLIRLDIIVELRGGMSLMLQKINTAAKIACYIVLLAMAVYWSIFSTFIDGWDAFLWLASFFFIELNLLSWQKENQEAIDPEVSLPAN